MVPLMNRRSSARLFSSALTDCLYKSLDCFNRTDDKLLPTCGFSFVPALLGFPWLYFVIRKGVGILKSCVHQMLGTKGTLLCTQLLEAFNSSARISAFQVLALVSTVFLCLWRGKPSGEARPTACVLGFGYTSKLSLVRGRP